MFVVAPKPWRVRESLVCSDKLPESPLKSPLSSDFNAPPMPYLLTMKERKRRYDPKNYTIVVEGRLDAGWSDYFDGFAITHTGGTTSLTGPVRDQAALHGLLNRIRDLNLVLISARRLDPQEEECEP